MDHRFLPSVNLNPNGTKKASRDYTGDRGYYLQEIEYGKVAVAEKC